ncbi:hypothetical protein AS189_13290 [Arthrobacter alpinus]|uniref:Uncharacterized protein n=1 Tax=Arthrobacter alpinus TaxID=656366 RepID=A0A0S2M0S1_9MICC|nr:hypothetical protein [Arthrobacter alpinus]ALO67298.1 hypothetical protein AS189_13290 [Arthrobacter alpinus]
MTEEAARPSPPWQGKARRDAAGRRGGYISAVLAAVVFFWLTNIWPGWQSLPFLDSATPKVLGIFNASLLVSAVVNLANAAVDRTWFRALGEIATSSIGIAVFARIWTVFPFDFGGSSFDWELVVRIALILASVGCAISILVKVVTLFRLALGTAPANGRGRTRNRSGHYGGSEP